MASWIGEVNLANWVALVGLVIALVGLILELTGAYLLASAFQPFVLRDFAMRAIQVSWQCIRRRRVAGEITPALARLIETVKKFGQQEAVYSFAGLSLISVGISLQILSVVLLIVVEVLRWH